MKKALLLLSTLGLVLFNAYGQENAKVLYENTKYTIKDAGSLEIENHYKVQINNDKGYDFGVYTDHVDQFSKIKSVTLTVYDKTGKKIKKLKKTDGEEYGFSGYNGVSDGKMFKLDPNFRQYPFTVEISSVVSQSGFLKLPHWMPRGYFHLSVVEATLEVTFPENYQLGKFEEFVKGTTETSNGTKILKYKVSNLEHIDKKMKYKDFYEEQPKVIIAPYKFKLDKSYGSNASWKDFGNWFVSLNDEPYELKEETKNFLSQLKDDDPVEKIKKIFNYMQDKTRYVSIQLGIGGFKSLPTKDVEKFGFGDCKALTTYMKNLLDYVGIKSNYVLVRAGEDAYEVNPDFVVNQFNHVYLGIPLERDTIYLECTSQIIPYNYSGTFTDDRNVLWIEKDNSRIIRSKVYSHNENLQNSKSSIRITNTGNAVMDLKILNKGVFFDEIFIYKNYSSDIIKEYNQNKFSYKDFSLKQFNYKQSDRNEAELSLEYTLEVKELGKKVGDRLLVPINPLIPFQDYIDENAFLKYSSIKRGMTIKDETEILLPDNYWVYDLPDVIRENSEYGDYELRVEFDDKKLKIIRVFTLYKGDYKKDEYEEFKKFFNKIIRLENRKLVLNSRT